VLERERKKDYAARKGKMQTDRQVLGVVAMSRRKRGKALGGWEYSRADTSVVNTSLSKNTLQIKTCKDSSGKGK